MRLRCMRLRRRRSISLYLLHELDGLLGSQALQRQCCGLSQVACQQLLLLLQQRLSGQRSIGVQVQLRCSCSARGCARRLGLLGRRCRICRRHGRLLGCCLLSCCLLGGRRRCCWCRCWCSLLGLSGSGRSASSRCARLLGCCCTACCSRLACHLASCRLGCRLGCCCLGCLGRHGRLVLQCCLHHLNLWCVSWQAAVLDQHLNLLQLQQGAEQRRCSRVSKVKAKTVRGPANGSAAAHRPTLHFSPAHPQHPPAPAVPLLASGSSGKTRR